MYFTYILYSPAADVLYRGSTRDLQDRLRRHNAGLEAATAPAAPWLLLWATPKKSRSEAYRLERKLKNLSRQRIIEFVRKYDEGLNADTFALLPDRHGQPTQDFHS